MRIAEKSERTTREKGEPYGTQNTHKSPELAVQPRDGPVASAGDEPDSAPLLRSPAVCQKGLAKTGQICYN